MTEPRCGHDSSRRSGLRILVNAGPTREYFDSVRFISNPSTGKQGYAVARVAAGRGHEVVLVSGPVALQDVPGVRMVRVDTAAEMAEACKLHFAWCDVAILTAAVCDYRPTRTRTLKLSKSAEPLCLTLEPTEDIAAALGQSKDHRLLITFAMDDHDEAAKAAAKMHRKNCDIVVQNSPANVGADRVTARLLCRRRGWQPPLSGSKDDIALHLIRIAERR